jgi:hypothetical protein
MTIAPAGPASSITFSDTEIAGEQPQIASRPKPVYERLRR